MKNSYYSDNYYQALNGNKDDNVLATLLKHVYQHSIMVLIASLFCATVIFVGLYDPHKNNFLLLVWAGFFIAITMLRITKVLLYQYHTNAQHQIILWRNLYILGCILGGASWGFVGAFLLPDVNTMQQTLIILVLAGVTAGAVPFTAAIPSAAIAFLVFSLLPLIVSVAFLNNRMFLLFDAALILYLIYTIVLSINTYQLIKNSIILQFENNDLLKKLEASNTQLKFAATHDPLTHVANRTLFTSHLENSIKYAKKNKNLLALFYLDVDRFKSANDQYGHEAGDQILKVIVERLNQCLRVEDTVARLGGDELAVIIKNIRSKHEIDTIAKKICQQIALPIKIMHPITQQEISINVSASIGISIYPYDGDDKDALLRFSDESMYYAKEKGGNRFYFYQDI